MAISGIWRTIGDAMPALCEIPTGNGNERRRDASMSDEAFQLINCFYDGIDIVVRDLAEEIAIEDNSYLPGQKDVLAIETRHVMEAGKRVVEALRGLLRSHALPKELEETLKAMGNCFENNCYE